MFKVCFSILSSLAENTPFFKWNRWYIQIWGNKIDRPFPNDIWNQRYTKKCHSTILSSDGVNGHYKNRITCKNFIRSGEVLPKERKLVIRIIFILFVHTGLKRVKVVKLNSLNFKAIFYILLNVHD